MKKKLYILVSFLILCGAFTLIYFLYFQNSQNQTFAEDITINGVNVCGLNVIEATQEVKNDIEKGKNDFNLTLSFGEDNWILSGENLKTGENVEKFVSDVFEYCNSQNMFNKIFNKHNQKEFNMSYDIIFEDLDSKLFEISNCINCEPQDSQMTFDANGENHITFSDEVYGKTSA